MSPLIDKMSLYPFKDQIEITMKEEGASDGVYVVCVAARACSGDHCGIFSTYINRGHTHV